MKWIVLLCLSTVIYFSDCSHIDSITWKSVTCIGKLHGGRSINCSSIHHNLQDSIQEDGLKNYTLFQFLENTAKLKGMFMTIQKETIGFQGVHGGTTIICDSSAVSGLQFSEVTDLFLNNINLLGCGGIFNSTFKLSEEVDTPLPIRAAIYIINCTNMQIKNIEIENSRGTGMVLIDCTGQVNILGSNFSNNSIENIKNESGGGGLYIEFSECSPGWVDSCNTFDNSFNSDAVYLISNCQFCNNTRTIEISNLENSTSLRRDRNGHGGGGMSLWIRGSSQNNSVKIENCLFFGNKANFGGGLYYQFQQNVSNTTILVVESSFKNNIADNGGGGMDFGSIFMEPSFPRMNQIFIVECTFEENEARIGGGTAIFTSLKKAINPFNSFVLTNCTWKGNSAGFGLAINVLSLFSGHSTNHFTPSLLLSDCIFKENRIIKNSRISRSSAVHLKIFPVLFNSTITFESNQGSGIVLIDSSITILRDTITTFHKNFGSFGGGISLQGFSTVIVQSNITLNFTNNYALFKGGAIYSYSLDQQLYPGSGTCFINIDKQNYNHSFRPRFYFHSNKASYTNSDSIYISSILPCLSLCSSKLKSEVNVFRTCIGDFEFADANIETQIATEGSSFFPPNVSNSMPVKAIPGKDMVLPFTIHDEFGNNATEILLISVIPDDVNASLSLDNSFTINNEVLLKGLPSENGILEIDSLYYRNLSIKLNLTLSECPPGFINFKSICECSAKFQDQNYNGITQCDTTTFTAFISYGYWAGYMNKGEEVAGENNLFSGICPLGYCQESRDKRSTYRIQLPTSASRVELDEVICGAQKRTGILCGDCVDKHSVYFHSWEYQCGHSQLCDYGIIFYFLSEIVPVTLTFGIVILTGINFNSGMLNGFVLFAQLSQSVSIMANGAIIYEDTERLFYDLSVLLYGPFNLNFFKIESLSFCIFKGANFFLIILMEFITLLYAFVLVISLVYLMRSRCSYKLQIACYRRGITTTTSLTKGLSAFLILCYSQATRLCYQILNTGLLKGQGEKSIYPLRVFRMGSVEYLTGIHIPFAIGAILILSTVVAIPPALLLAYPIVYKVLPKWVQKIKMVRLILNKLENYRPLFDTFQGCFRDKHRYFAGLYFVYRSIFITTFFLINTRLVFFSTNQIIITSMLLIHLWMQPYKQTLHNFIDGILFFFLAVINMLTLWRFVLSYVQIRPQEIFHVGITQLIILFLPGIIVILLLVHKFCHKRFMTFWRKTLNEQSNGNSEDSKENLQYYRAFSDSEEKEQTIL